MLQAIAQGIVRLMGWRVVGEKPPPPRSVIIGAPHTSNFDGVMLIFAAIILRVNLRWLVKHSLYNTPFRPILKWSGAIPIDRSGGQNVVEQAAQILRSSEDIHLALAPEGTRKRTNGWKSGFYYIALRAKAPIYFGFIDYKLRECGIGGHMEPTGDIEADMQVIKAFYETKTPRFPENYGEIKLAPRRGHASQPRPETQSE
jgi:1-acyl-sn-glycerol-3-phosphate acyltransferase